MMMRVVAVVALAMVVSAQDCQSPIVIEGYGLDSNELKPLTFNGDAFSGTVEKQKLTLGDDDIVTMGSSALAQVHIHWGPTDDQGSEHRLGAPKIPRTAAEDPWARGSAYAAEAHFVFADAAGRLSVVGLWLQAVEDGAGNNPGVETFLSSNKTQSTSLKEWGVDGNAYYTYLGGLTTGECPSQPVKWFVLATPASITQSQLNRLRAIPITNDEYAPAFNNNTRVVQPLKGRVVTAFGTQTKDHMALKLWPANEDDNEDSDISSLAVAGILMLVWFVLVFISGCWLYKKAQMHTEERSARQENEKASA